MKPLTKNNSFIDIYLLIIPAIAIFIFLDAKTITAFDWPAIDMGAFFERFYDKNFLPNDFFTNASAAPNPRFIFGYFIIFLAKLFDNSWYKTFFFLKIFFTLTIPTLFYLYLTSPIKQGSQDDGEVFFAKSVIAIFIIYILSNIEKFAIAWWPPLFYFAGPQTMSLLVGLLAINLLNYSENKKNEFFALVLLFIATLLHPTMGLCLFIFDFIFNFNPSRKYLYKTIVRALFTIFIPYLILYYSFASEAQISNIDFVQYYIFAAHPHHYLPSQFGTFNDEPWHIGFIILSCGILLALIIGVIIRDQKIILTAGLSLFFYVGCVIAQYFLVEIYQIKNFAQLGISRFLFLGYWLLTGCYGLVALKLIQKKYIICDHFKNFFKQKSAIPLNGFYFIALLFLINFATYKMTMDNPFQRLDKESDGLFFWIANNIENDSVILTDIYKTEIPLLAKRATFMSGFPFREEFFIENYQRNLIVKKIPQLTNEDLLEINKNYKADYVLLPNSTKTSLPSGALVFCNKKYSIFKTPVRDKK